MKPPAQKGKRSASDVTLGYDLPLSRSAEARRDALRKELRGLGPEERLEKRRAFSEARRAHPDTPAIEALRRHLEAAHFDPAILASPNVAGIVAFLRDLAHATSPGDTTRDCLQLLVRFLADHGGARPKQDETYGRWNERFAALKATRQTLSAREIYEDIAYEEEDRRGAHVPWTRIRDGILAHRKRDK